MATAVDARTAVPEDAPSSPHRLEAGAILMACVGLLIHCLLYTSDAADE